MRDRLTISAAPGHKRVTLLHIPVSDRTDPVLDTAQKRSYDLGLPLLVSPVPSEAGPVPAPDPATPQLDFR